MTEDKVQYYVGFMDGVSAITDIVTVMAKASEEFKSKQQYVDAFAAMLTAVVNINQATMSRLEKLLDKEK